MEFIISVNLWQLLPKLFAARCPVCNARLESVEQLDEIYHWQTWRLVWHHFFCGDCGYRWRRIEIGRRPKELQT